MVSDENLADTAISYFHARPGGHSEYFPNARADISRELACENMATLARDQADAMYDVGAVAWNMSLS